MNYDVPFRHQQALDPSALTTITATLRAIGKAVEDCRSAGVSPDSDPAVALLTRHMATVSSNHADEDTLRAACNRRIGEIKRFPTLLALAIRGVEYDVAAKSRFHEDGRSAMLLLATALGLAPETYTWGNRGSESQRHFRDAGWRFPDKMKARAHDGRRAQTSDGEQPWTSISVLTSR